MKLFFVYSPEVIADPTDTIESLGGGFDGVFAKVGGALLDIDLPEAGYAVIVNTWEGITVLPGPLTAGFQSSITDPGPSPEEQERRNRIEIFNTISASSSYIDPALIQEALAKLNDIINTGSVPLLGQSPTTADVIQQVRTLTTAANLLADAVRTLAKIDRGIIRFLR